MTPGTTSTATYRLHPGLGLRPLHGGERYLALTESQLPSQWIALTEPDRRRLSTDWWGKVLHAAGAEGQDAPPVAVTLDDRADAERFPDATKASGHRIHLTYSQGLLPRLFAVAFTVIEFPQPVAVTLFDTWDGGFLMQDPSPALVQAAAPVIA